MDITFPVLATPTSNFILALLCENMQSGETPHLALFLLCSNAMYED